MRTLQSRRTPLGKFAILAGLLCSPYFARSTDAALVGLWQFEGDFTDSSVQENDGTAAGTNTPTFAAGKVGFGQAGSFSGASPRVVVPDAASLDITTDITLAAWVNHSNGGFEGLIAKNPTAGSGNNFPGNYELRLNSAATNKNVDFLWEQTSGPGLGSLTSTATVAANTWTHVAVTATSGGSVTFYTNGVAQASGTATAFGEVNNNPLYIGNRADLTSTPFNGLLDDVAVFNEVLDSGQIATIRSGDFSDFIPISGVTVKDFSSQLIGFGGRLAEETINGSGFTSATGVHDTDAGSMWLTRGTAFEGGDDPLPAHITYDLGSNYDLNSLTVWNYNEAAAGNTDRGAEDVEISVATSEGGPFTSLGDFEFDVAPGTTSNFGQLIDLSSFPAANSVRLVRLDITSNYGDTDDAVGLSEIRFFGTVVPEPNTTGLAILGLISLSAVMSRRRRR